MREKLVLADSATEQEAQKLVRLFGSGQNHIAHLGILLASIHKVIRKRCKFELGFEQKQALNSLQRFAAQEFPLRSHDLTFQMILKCL